jgi:putative intracellular protease/amidase
MIVGILLFPEVEVLDFAGPFQVFSMAERNGTKLFNVVTVSERHQLIKCRNGLQVLADMDFDSAPAFDILIVPGGFGAEQIEINNEVLLQWIKVQYKKVKILASVCPEHSCWQRRDC